MLFIERLLAGLTIMADPCQSGFQLDHGVFGEVRSFFHFQDVLK